MKALVGCTSSASAETFKGVSARAWPEYKGCAWPHPIHRTQQQTSTQTDSPLTTLEKRDPNNMRTTDLKRLGTMEQGSEWSDVEDS